MDLLQVQHLLNTKNECILQCGFARSSESHCNSQLPNTAACLLAPSVPSVNRSTATAEMKQGNSLVYFVVDDVLFVCLFFVTMLANHGSWQGQTRGSRED